MTQPMSMTEVATRWVDAALVSGRSLRDVVEIARITNKHGLFPKGLYFAVVEEVADRAEVRRT